MRHVEVDLAGKVRTLQQNSYFEGLPEDLLKRIAGKMYLREFERSGAIRMEERRIHISDPETLKQWMHPSS